MKRTDRRLVRIAFILSVLTCLLASCEAYVMTQIPVMVIKQTKIEI